MEFPIAIHWLSIKNQLQSLHKKEGIEYAGHKLTGTLIVHIHNPNKDFGKID